MQGIDINKFSRKDFPSLNSGDLNSKDLNYSGDDDQKYPTNQNTTDKAHTKDSDGSTGVEEIEIGDDDNLQELPGRSLI